MKIKSILLLTGIAVALHAQDTAPAAEKTEKPSTKTGGGAATTTQRPASVGGGYGNSFGGGGGGGGGFGGVAGNGGGMPGMGMMGGSTSYANRLSGLVSRAPQNAGSIAVFDAKPQKEMDELAEDLNVLAHIASRNLERSLGEKQTEYRLGVPILMDNRLVQARYIEGFGVLISVNVPFPVAAGGKAEKKSESTQPASDWERVKASIYGGGPEATPPSNEGLQYDEALAASLKKQMLDVVLNGANVRHIKGDEWIAVIVYGGANVGDSVDASRSTVLTVRAKKSVAEAGASAVAQNVQSHAYLSGAPTPAGRSAYTYGWGIGGQSGVGR